MLVSTAQMIGPTSAAWDGVQRLSAHITGPPAGRSPGTGLPGSGRADRWATRGIGLMLCQF